MVKNILQGVIMRSLIIGSLVLATLFVGCKSSGGFCCNGEVEEQEV